mmetsp:Transcript_32941/g.65515  ORF Transcript_32941/g.65515 Transcript_32941/m.65515 type:complete len:542 (-) Transcript_32941:281-1906(-)
MDATLTASTEVAAAEEALALAVAARDSAKTAAKRSMTTKAALKLASEALADMRPNDLDEVKAIRGNPPACVKQVVCCVCSLLALAEDSPPSSSSPQLATIDVVSPPAVSASGEGGNSARWRQALALSPAQTAEGCAIHSWPVAQKRVGVKGFKQALLSFDARCLLAGDAAKVVEAVKQRIAIEDEGSVFPGALAEAHAGVNEALRTPRSPCLRDTTGLLTSAPASAASISSIAAAAAAARRAANQAATDLSRPLTLGEATRASHVIGTLFLWCSRVLANAEQLRQGEENERVRKQEAAIELERCEVAVARAEEQLRASQETLTSCMGQAEERERKAREREREAREREKQDAEAERMKVRLEATRAAPEEDAEKTRHEQMAAAEATARGDHERELAKRKAQGKKAVLEEVDIVIHQKVEFRAGCAVVEDANIPALICVADIMLGNPKIKVGVEAAPGIELAADRAEAIVGWLVEQGGVSVSRLRTTGAAGSGGGGGSGAEATGSAVGTWHVRFNVISEIKISDQLQFDGGMEALHDTSKDTV